MNIFTVLSTGKSNLHEPSMSAMLAYLLNPNQDHGLGDKVIEQFLQLANTNHTYTEYLDRHDIKFQIDLEVPYKLGTARNDIDIQIKILDNNNNNQELHRIIIENKIKTGAANPKQLSKYHQAVMTDKKNDDPFTLGESKLSVIFLTPKLNHKGLNAEFNNLDSANKVWLYWNSVGTSDDTIVSLIQNLLKLEQTAETSPINEYMRHTLKAFTHYIIKTINHSGKNRISENIGEEKAKDEIQINGDIYTIVLRDSMQIQLFTQEGDQVIARPLLKVYLKEHAIENRYGVGTNTRSLGKQVFAHIQSKRNTTTSNVEQPV